jgi:hypothetical protein
MVIRGDGRIQFPVIGATPELYLYREYAHLLSTVLDMVAQVFAQRRMYKQAAHCVGHALTLQIDSGTSKCARTH